MLYITSSEYVSNSSSILVCCILVLPVPSSAAEYIFYSIIVSLSYFFNVSLSYFCVFHIYLLLDIFRRRLHKYKRTVLQKMKSFLDCWVSMWRCGTQTFHMHTVICCSSIVPQQEGGTRKICAGDCWENRNKKHEKKRTKHRNE